MQCFAVKEGGYDQASRWNHMEDPEVSSLYAVMESPELLLMFGARVEPHMPAVLYTGIFLFLMVYLLCQTWSKPTHTLDNHSYRAPHDVIVWAALPPRGVCYNAGSLSGVRRSEGESTSRRRGLFIETQFPALCKDARRRRTTSRYSRAHQSSRCNYDESTGLKTTVRSGRPKPSNNEVHGRTDRQTMR